MSDINSLAYFKAHGIDVTAFCETPCHHSAKLDIDKLIHAFGPEFCIAREYDRFIRSLKCDKCGSRSISIILGTPKRSIIPSGGDEEGVVG